MFADSADSSCGLDAAAAVRWLERCVVASFQNLLASNGRGRMRFDVGRVLLRRYWTGGSITVMNVNQVLADDELGLRLWQPAGMPYWRILTGDGKTQHEAPFAVADPSARLAEVTWRGSDVMVWIPPEGAYSVWWFWDPETGEFQGWYGNLEARHVRWDDGLVAGIDTADHALDLVVDPDGQWSWKDREEFDQRSGHPLCWDSAAADDILAEADRLAARASRRVFPFDGTWCDRPSRLSSVDAGRPAGWSRPRPDLPCLGEAGSG